MPEDEIAGVEIQMELGAFSTTQRGFEIVHFKDEYDLDFSLQISSRCICEDEHGNVADPKGWVWLGIDDAKPQIMKRDAARLGMTLPPGEVTGWMPFPVPNEVMFHTRMHLNERQVRGLMARLQNWLDTGSFE